VPARWYLTIALVLMAVTFLVVRVVLALDALRLLLTPSATKNRRVHRRALALFRTAAEKRTRGSTGVLVYLSLAEHRAEIIADEAIHSKVTADVWGAAMAALIGG
jgi:putative membrane protein